MLAERQRVDTDVRIQARTIPVSDLAQPTAEVERRRGDVFGAQEEAARAERALKALILDDTADSLWTVRLDPVDVPDPQIVERNADQALADAMQYRPELAEARADVSIRNVQIELAKDGLKPAVDVVASYTMRGLAGDRNPGVMPFGPLSPTVPPSLSGGLGTSWDALAHNRFPDASMGVTVDVPLGRRGARGELGAAEAARRQSATALSKTRQQIAVDVQNAITSLETAAGRIQAARAGLVAAETQLRAEEDRYSVGATTNFFVLTRQTDLALAQLTEIDALTAYRIAATELARATGTLLRDRGVQIE
jgi:outer membrane protein TolC